jgi:hypothetical protein
VELSLLIPFAAKLANRGRSAERIQRISGRFVGLCVVF